MADQIIQTLGFDASSAITTINTLNKSLAGLNTQLNSVARGAKAFNKANLGKSLKAIANAKPAQSLNNAATAAGTLGQKITQAGNQGGQALKNLNNQSKSLTLSWQTLSRIIVAQTIVRGFNAITGSIRNAITETRELQKRIGEIQTIAGGRLGGAEDIAAGLQVTAETFGFGILDVAEAKYQELSNQVDGSTESLEFQTAAAKLARATNTSLTDATNLLSSTLNAFGKDASSANSAAGLLFTTIEQGRIRANELANSLGRVAPLANALGVDFNELGAGLARVTQGGTRADAAITQLLGIMNKLQAPTPALAAAFERLGVATAQEGIQQSGGFLPFLIRLKKEAGDVSELTSFFKNIRAIQGVLALVGTDADKTAGVFEALGLTAQQSGERMQEAFDTATANDAVEYEKLIQKLSGTFRELATTVIPLINSALELFIGTLDAIRANPVFTGALFVGTTAALGTMAVSSFAAAGGFIALGTAAKLSLAALGPMALAFGVLVVSATALALVLKNNEIERYAPLVERVTKRLDDMNESIAASKKALDEQSQGFKDASREAVEFGRQFTELRKVAQEAVRDLNSEFVDSSTSALNSLLKTRQSITKEIQKAIEQADAAATKSSEKVASIQAKKDDFLLQRRLNNLNDLQKAFKLFQTSQDQAFAARDLISGVTDLAGFDAAADVLDRRLKLAQQGLAAAKASGDPGAIARAEQQVVTALNDQINLEKQRGQLIKARRVAAEEAAAKDKAQTQELKTLVSDIQKQISILNTGGGLLNDTQLATQEKKVADLLQKLSEFGLTSEQIDLGEFLGIQDLTARFQKDLAATQRTISEKRGSIVGEVEQIYADLNALVDDNIIEIAIKLNLTEGGPDQIKSLIDAFATGSKEIDNLTGAQKRFEAAQLRATANQKAFQDLFKDTTLLGKPWDELTEAIGRLSTNADTTEADVQRLVDSLRGLSARDIFLKEIDLGGAAGDQEVLDNTLKLFRALVKTRQNLEEVEVDTQGDRDRLQQLLQFQEVASQNIGAVQAIIDVLGSASDAAGQIGQSALGNIQAINSNDSAWDGVAESAKLAKDAVLAYNRAVAASPPPPSGGAQPKMFGGTLYRAAGGTARGTDTIPAMLSPGEFVVNASSSRRFASQLQAINSGSNPVFRQEGGAITNNNVNIGDINVNGTADPDDTARRVLSKIRREFRRGTASRF